MTQDDLRKEIRELRAQIEALRTALSDVTRPYTELMAYVDRLQDVSPTIQQRLITDRNALQDRLGRGQGAQLPALFELRPRLLLSA